MAEIRVFEGGKAAPDKDPVLGTVSVSLVCSAGLLTVWVRGGAPLDEIFYSHNEDTHETTVYHGEDQFTITGGAPVPVVVDIRPITAEDLEEGGPDE